MDEGEFPVYSISTNQEKLDEPSQSIFTRDRLEI